MRALKNIYKRRSTLTESSYFNFKLSFQNIKPKILAVRLIKLTAIFGSSPTLLA